MGYLIYGTTIVILVVGAVWLWREHIRIRTEADQSLFVLKDIFERTYPNENTLHCSTADLHTRKNEEETSPQKGYLVLSDMGVYFFVPDAEHNKLSEEIAQTWSTIQRSSCMERSFRIDLSGYSCIFDMNKKDLKKVADVISGLPSVG